MWGENVFGNLNKDTGRWNGIMAKVSKNARGAMCGTNGHALFSKKLNKMLLFCLMKTYCYRLNT